MAGSRAPLRGCWQPVFPSWRHTRRPWRSRRIRQAGTCVMTAGACHCLIRKFCKLEQDGAAARPARMTAAEGDTGQTRAGREDPSPGTPCSLPSYDSPSTSIPEHPPPCVSSLGTEAACRTSCCPCSACPQFSGQPAPLRTALSHRRAVRALRRGPFPAVSLTMPSCGSAIPLIPVVCHNPCSSLIPARAALA